jgi:peroxiredoxin
MTQLRQDYSRFQQFNTDIIVLVPNGPKLVEKYTRTNDIPYTILTDKGSKIAAQFFQLKKFFLFGTPTVFLIARAGKIIYTHFADSLIEEPDNEIPLKLLDNLSGQNSRTTN